MGCKFFAPNYKLFITVSFFLLSTAQYLCGSILIFSNFLNFIPYVEKQQTFSWHTYTYNAVLFFDA